MRAVVQVIIEGHTLDLRQASASQGLAAVKLLAHRIEEVLPLMGQVQLEGEAQDSSSIVRLLARIVEVMDTDLIRMLSLLTGLPEEFISDELTLAGVLELLQHAVRINDVSGLLRQMQAMLRVPGSV